MFRESIDGGDARDIISNSLIARALKECGHVTYRFSYDIVDIPAEQLFWIESLIAFGSYMGLKLRRARRKAVDNAIRCAVGNRQVATELRSFGYSALGDLMNSNGEWLDLEYLGTQTPILSIYIRGNNEVQYSHCFRDNKCWIILTIDAKAVFQAVSCVNHDIRVTVLWRPYQAFIGIVVGIGCQLTLVTPQTRLDLSWSRSGSQQQLSSCSILGDERRTSIGCFKTITHL